MRPYFPKLMPGVHQVLRYGAAAGLAVIFLVAVGCTASDVKETRGFTINQSTGQVSWGCSVTVTDPPGNYLCNFNASQALINFRLTNAATPQRGFPQALCYNFPGFSRKIPEVRGTIERALRKCHHHLPIWRFSRTVFSFILFQYR